MSGQNPAHAFDPDLIPSALTAVPQWVRWSPLTRNGSKKPTKVPFHPTTDAPASSTDPETWGTFEDALAHVGQHGTCGAGFVLTEHDPFVGVDFDHVLVDGRLDPVAAEIIEDLHSYSEVSPSGHGVRVIVRGQIPVDVKHKVDLGNGAILEFWDRKRFVTMTGNLLPGSTEEINDASEALCRIIDRYDLAPQRGRAGQGGTTPPACAVPLEERISRAQRYVARVPGAVEGEFGSTATFMLAQRVVRGFALPEPEALQVLEPWNKTCRPPWPDKDLERKVNEAAVKGRMPWACMVGGPLPQPEPAPALHAVPDDAAGHEPSWRDGLLWIQLAGGAKRLKPCVSNAALFLSDDPEWAGRIRSDTFGGFTSYVADGGPIDAPAGRWSDQHTLETWRWLETRRGLFVSLDVTHSAVKLAAARDPFNPLQDWLDSLVWDGIPRLDTWLEDLAGVPRTPYAMAVARKFLVSAVARAVRPGSKADHALLLEGAQGIGKSTLLATLFSPWFTDEISVLGSKDASMQMRGVWCVEIGELDSMHRSEISSVKAFMSRTVDRYRPSYGREIIEVPRTAVFTGSTNSTGYLKDDTGARRFWPVACSCIDLPAARACKEQLWAEALVAFRAGETWWLDLEEQVQAAISEQELRFDEDPWTEAVESAVSAWQPLTPMTSAAVLLKIGVEVPKQSRVDQMRVASILRRMGYAWKRTRRDGELLRVWSRRESE